MGGYESESCRREGGGTGVSPHNYLPTSPGSAPLAATYAYPISLAPAALAQRDLALQVGGEAKVMDDLGVGQGDGLA